MTIIETERLILRTWQDEDIPLLARMHQDPKVMAHYPNLMTFEQTQEAVTNMRRFFDEHGFGMYAVELKETGEFIGRVGLHIPAWYEEFKPFKVKNTPCVEIGWKLASEHHGKGYATEAAKAVLEYAFNVLKLNEVVAFTVPANKASQRVMEKIGMLRDIESDFKHPRLSADHPLSLHVLYRISKK